MQPSSLVFLLIVGVWAAYFVHYWVRRRDHLATARNADALSESLRVLGRRERRPGTRLTRPAAAAPGHRTPRAVWASVAADAGPSAAVSSSTSTSAGSLPPRDEPPGPPPSSASDAPARPVVPRMRPRRSVRGLTFLAGLLATVVVSVVATFGVLPPWAALLPVLVAVGGFLWLRAGVRAQTAARRAALARRRAERAGKARRGRPERDAPHTSVAAVPAAAPASAARAAAAAPAPSAPAPASIPAAAAVAGAAEPPAAVVALPQVDEDDIPLTWDPVPVPRPTYTMKAPARSRPAPPLEQAPAGPEASSDAHGAHPAYRAAGRSAAGA